MGQQKREKINRPEHTAGRSQNQGTKQVQRGAHRLRTGPAPPEAGGRGQGKGAGSAPRTAAPTALQTGLQFLTTDLLRFWMVDTRREGRGKTQGAGTDRRGRKLRLGTRRVEGARTGECARQAPGCLSRSEGEGTNCRRSRVRALVEHPRAGTARSAGPAPYRAAGSLSSVDGESSASPSPQRDGTSNLNKRPPPPACVRAEMRH